MSAADHSIALAREQANDRRELKTKLEDAHDELMLLANEVENRHVDEHLKHYHKQAVNLMHMSTGALEEAIQYLKACEEE